MVQFIKVDPAGSYLSDAENGDDIASTRINLTDYGVVPGQILVLTAVGDYAASQGWSDDEDGLVAVFIDSTGNYLAPDVFSSAYTEEQSSGLATDIPQDFRLPGGELTHVRVPTGAAELLFSVQDIYFADNNDPDGDFGVEVDFDSDGMVSGGDAIRWIQSAAQKAMSSEEDGDARPFAFFDLIDWSAFLGESWSSQLYLTSDSESLAFRSPNAALLEVRSEINEGPGSASESFNFFLKTGGGDELDWSLEGIGSWGPNSESSRGSVSMTYTKKGSPANDADDIELRYTFSASGDETWGDEFSSGTEEATGSWEISKGDTTSGFRYSLDGLNESGQWSWSPSKQTESWRGSYSNLHLEDFDLGLAINFSVEVRSNDNGEAEQFTFRDLNASYQGKTYAAETFDLIVGEDEFQVELTNYSEVISFFRTEFLDRIKTLEVSGTTKPVTPAENLPAPTSPPVMTPSTPPSVSVTNPTLPVSSDGIVKQVVASSANESFFASPGEQKIALPVKSTEVSIQSTDGGKTWTISGAQLGTDTVVGFKRVQLEDATVALDFAPGESGHAAVTIIGTAFGKDFVGPYFGAGAALFDSGKSKAEVSKLIVDLGLIESLVGPSDDAWVRHVYKNVVGADPDPFTEAAFVALLQDGSFDRTSLLALAADVPLVESQINLAGLQTTGLIYSGLI